MADQPPISCFHCGTVFVINQWPREMLRDGHSFVAECSGCRQKHGFFVSVIEDSIFVDCHPVDPPPVQDVGAPMQRDALGESVLASASVRRGDGEALGPMGVSGDTHRELRQMFDGTAEPEDPSVYKFEDDEGEK